MVSKRRSLRKPERPSTDFSHLNSKTRAELNTEHILTLNELQNATHLNDSERIRIAERKLAYLTKLLEKK